jgi:hypothetical protein
MTVRAWFTISAVALGVLTVAFLIWLTGPSRAPRLVASAGNVRLQGSPAGSCWPARSGKLSCSREPRRRGPATRIAPSGTIRVFADFPVQPEDGSVRILRGDGSVASESKWTDRLPYSLEPGSYDLIAEGRWRRGAFVRYDFALAVR